MNEQDRSLCPTEKNNDEERIKYQIIMSHVMSSKSNECKENSIMAMAYASIK